MSDKEIRKILIEKKKREYRYQEMKAFAEGVVGFSSLFLICLMMAVIGG